MQAAPPEAAPGCVIVTHGRSLAALAAVRSLGQHGVDVIVGDEVSLTPAGLSRYAKATFRYRDPGADPNGFVDDVEAACREHAPGDGRPLVLMPIHREAYPLARARRRLDAVATVPLAPWELIDRVRHKSRLVDVAAAAGVPMPRTWRPRSMEEMRVVAEEVPYPAFVKRPTGVAGAGIKKVRNAAELLAAAEDLVTQLEPSPDDFPLVQAAVDGDDVCVAVLFDQGRLVASVCYRNVASFPRDRGPGAIRDTLAAPGLVAMAERLLGSIGWHGIAELDFRWSGREDDPGVLIEVNPRFFSGLGHVMAAGVDLPWMLYCMATGQPLPASEADPTTRTEIPLVGLLATLAEAAEGGESLDRMESAWREAVHAARNGALLLAGRRLLDGLEALDFAGRMERLRERLAAPSDSESALLQGKDPLPVLGLMYPLALFLRHGKITEELMAGADRA